MKKHNGTVFAQLPLLRAKRQPTSRLAERLVFPPQSSKKRGKMGRNVFVFMLKTLATA
jgi:hypothetical protein